MTLLQVPLLPYAVLLSPHAPSTVVNCATVQSSVRRIVPSFVHPTILPLIWHHLSHLVTLPTVFPFAARGSPRPGIKLTGHLLRACYIVLSAVTNDACFLFPWNFHDYFFIIFRISVSHIGHFGLVAKGKCLRWPT